MSEAMSRSDPAQVRGYCMYDWGKSAFETSVTTAVLPAWFTYLFWEANGLSFSSPLGEMSSDAMWSFSVTGAALFIALISPALGVIADRRTVKVRWMRYFTYLGAASTFLLAFAPVFGVSYGWVWLTIMFLLANVGLNGAGVFYNALLPHQGADDEMDGISNKAYAYGYLGGGLLLVVHLGMVLGLSGDWVVPFVMASSGVWWFGFAMWTFAAVPEPAVENEMENLGFVPASKMAMGEVMNTLRDWRSFKTLFVYMIAYFLFIDGINSVTSLAGAFGIAVLGLSMTDLIATIVVIQFVAFPAAYFFTWLAEVWSTKRALMLSLFMWCVMIVGAMSFAPLELSEAEEYDFRLDGDGDAFTLTMDLEDPFGESAEERALASDWAVLIDGGSVGEVEARSLVMGLEQTRFSGHLNLSDGSALGVVGIDHPTNLGDGAMDFIPKTVRSLIWAPLGIGIFWQWLMLGCLAGTLMGGSQGLARSLFAQMVPETRSTEFFGFFGFFGKVAALLGPLLYGTISVAMDSRTAIASLALLIIGGTIMMRWVDVEDGILVANEYDAAVRSGALGDEPVEDEGELEEQDHGSGEEQE